MEANQVIDSAKTDKVDSKRKGAEFYKSPTKKTKGTSDSLTLQGTSNIGGWDDDFVEVEHVKGTVDVVVGRKKSIPRKSTHAQNMKGLFAKCPMSIVVFKARSITYIP
ncbi:hypothetical protein QVD17_12042 [Tagetes erecta]|uniref:Uncharacterized protein n=1 Tax=Tagetes erecta TaxID=13708 RepID=A0AAD8KYI8_TARER|nr:hypothetical protein QVD17_12042 [Tagetes erecta]